jgi:hypothetical protein
VQGLAPKGGAFALGRLAGDFPAMFDSERNFQMTCIAVRTKMSASETLRIQAARLLALVLKARENGDSKLADLLDQRAMQYSEKATAIEEAIRPPSSPPESSQPNVQWQEQIPANKE